MKLFKTYLSIPVEHSKGSEMAINTHLDKIVQRPAKLFTYSVIIYWIINEYTNISTFWTETNTLFKYSRLPWQGIVDEILIYLSETTVSVQLILNLIKPSKFFRKKFTS